MTRLSQRPLTPRSQAHKRTSLRDSSAELPLALTPVTAVLAGTQRAAPVRRVDPVADGVLHHWVHRFGKPPLFRANRIRLLDYLDNLGLGYGVQPARAVGAGSDHGVRAKLQSMVSRDAIGPLRGRLKVN